MMTLEQIRQRNKAENAAARRLQAAGYRLEGWDPRTGQRIAAQITGENTNDERRTFYAFPTWQDAAACAAALAFGLHWRQWFRRGASRCRWWG